MFSGDVGRITIDDVDQLANLTQITYGRMWKRAGGGAYYNWKIFNDDLPRSNGYAARVDASVVGFIASQHRRFRFGDEICWSTELGDAMTHPDYRRQGIWESLSKMVIKNALESGFMPIYGFPNKLSYPGLIKKCSMEHFFDVWRLGLFLRPGISEFSEMNIPKWLEKSGLYVYSTARYMWNGITKWKGREFSVERDVNIDTWVDDLWKEEAEHHEAGVIKDSRYLRWRFIENPDNYRLYRANNDRGKPVGFLVTKTRIVDKDKSCGFMADMMVPSRKRAILHRLLFEAETDFKQDRVVLVDAWTTSHPFYFYGLVSYGFLPARHLPFIVHVSQADILRRKGWSDSRNWVLTMADSDNV